MLTTTINRIGRKIISAFYLIKYNYFYTVIKSQITNASIWKIFTHTTQEERVFLYQIASKLSRNNTIVEIGSYLGASTCFLAAGCDRKGGHVYAIDTWENQALSEGLRNTYEEFLDNISDYKHKITPIRSFSVDAAQDFSKPIDFIFVDGDHSYEGDMADLEAWLPKLKPKAWLVLHDIGWAEGVNRAIKEIVEPIAISKPIVLPNLYAVRVDYSQAK
jgi:predicted O-methyltransferase YrrM